MNEIPENKIFIVGTLLCAICLLITLFLWHNRIIPNQKNDTVYTEKRDTFWKDTTIFEKQFVPSIIVKTKKGDTLYSKKGDTLYTESKMYQKSFISDKDTADAKIYVSGVKTSLDSVKMRFKTHREVVTKTIEITKEKPKTFFDRFHLGLQVGYGLGLKSREFEPYVGVGVGINL